MDATQALQQIQIAGLRCRVAHGGSLIVSPAPKITPRLRQIIKTNKGGLLALLAKVPATPCAQCGSSGYWQVKAGGSWQCIRCNPATLTEQTTTTVAGGQASLINSAPPKPLRETLEEATARVVGISSGQLYAALDDGDMKAVKAGLIGKDAR